MFLKELNQNKKEKSRCGIQKKTKYPYKLKLIRLSIP